MLFPSPPPELKCHVTDAAAIQWPRDGPDSLPFVTATHCNFVKPQLAIVKSSDRDNMVTETSVDNVTHCSDSEHMDSTLALIRKGVKLRKTVTSDRSAPKLN